MTPPRRVRLGDPDVRYPVAALNLAAVRSNVAEMDRYCRESVVQIAPHAKTTMVADILSLQASMASTWGLTFANATQAQSAEHVAAQRIFIANQLVERPDIAWVAGHIEAGRQVFSFVDTVAGVQNLDANLARSWVDAAAAPKHPVLIEVGYRGGRCGTRSRGDFDAVAEAVRGSQHLELLGVAGFEGLLGGDGGAEGIARVDAYLNLLASAATYLADRWGISGAGTIISAGGSAFFDRVVDVCRDAARRTGALLLLRSGCYAIHDHGIYAGTGPSARARSGPELRAAATVWARIQSRPDAQRAIAAVGRRHLPHDAGLPVPLGIRYRAGIRGPLPDESYTVALSDQHLHLELPPHADLAVGDVVPFGVSHPCGLFDRWRTMTVVDDQRRVEGTVSPSF